MKNLLKISFRGKRKERSHKIADRNWAVRGFTLVELIVVAAILAVLAGLVIPSYNLLVERAKVSACIGDIRTLEKSILAYAAEKGDLPSRLTDLTGIAQSALSDPWGNSFVYNNLIANPADAFEDSLTGYLNTDFDLVSKGAKGATAKAYDASGADDIVRSGDGGYVGLRP